MLFSLCGWYTGWRWRCNMCYFILCNFQSQTFTTNKWFIDKNKTTITVMEQKSHSDEIIVLKMFKINSIYTFYARIFHNEKKVVFFVQQNTIHYKICVKFCQNQKRRFHKKKKMKINQTAKKWPKQVLYTRCRHCFFPLFPHQFDFKRK